MARYRIVPERSRVWVDARTSVHPIHGESTGVNGYIELKVTDSGPDLSTPPKARVELPIESLTSGNRLYDREMLRRVDARRYPVITGELREVDAAPQEGRYRVRGEVTFHGRTQTLDGEVTARFEGRTVEIEGERTFNVEDYGVRAPRILMLRVFPDVNVRVDLLAERED